MYVSSVLVQRLLLPLQTWPTGNWIVSLWGCEEGGEEEEKEEGGGGEGGEVGEEEEEEEGEEGEEG